MSRKFFTRRAALCGLFSLILVFFGLCEFYYLTDLLSTPFIFSDTGDGYFNLWLLEKGWLKFFAGHTDNFRSGGIFWPHAEGTYFWSDNLILYVPLYGFLKTLTTSSQLAYTLCSYTLCLASFGASLFFFYMLYLCSFSATTTPSPSSSCPSSYPGVVYFIPAFAYCATFAEAKLRYLYHWQNLSYFWVVLAVAAGLGISYTGLNFLTKSRLLVLVALAQTCLLLSTLYFAVVTFILGALWVLVQVRLDGKLLWNLCKSRWLLLTLLGFVQGVIGWVYAQSGAHTYSLWYLYHNALRFSHLIHPSAGFFKTLLTGSGIAVAEVNHEIIGYVGLGVLLAGLILGLSYAKRGLLFAKEASQHAYFWVFLSFLCVWRSLEYVDRGLAGYVGLAALALLLGHWVLALGKQAPYHPWQRAFSFLGLCLLTTYGIAFGPLRHFINSPVNPSLWGLFSSLVPPVANMRAIGRLGGIGHTFLLGSLFLILCYLLKNAASHSRKKRLVYSLAASLVFLQALDSQGIQPPRSFPEERAITPTAAEIAWWQDKTAAVLVFPSRPFHSATLPMLYFSQFPKLSLLNGYSAHSTPDWDALMALAQGQQEPQPAQLALGRQLGAQWLVLMLEQLPANALARVEGYLAVKPAFSNDRFAVFALSGTQALPEKP